MTSPILASALLTGFAVLSQPGRERAHSAPSQPFIEEFDIAGDGDAVLVPVAVRGAQYLFEFDTGTYRVCYDSALRPLLGLVRESEVVLTPFARVRRELFEAPEATLGKLPLRLPPTEVTPLVTCIDLQRLRETAGSDLRGILGMSFLRRHAVRLDFDRGKLAFLKEVGPEAGARIPIRFTDERREVSARLPGLGEVMFQIDTGAIGSSGSMRSSTIRELERRNCVQRLPTALVVDTVGNSETRCARVSSFRLGEFEHSNLIFYEHSDHFPNVLGLGYWMRYVVTFDFPNRAVYLRPSKQFQHTDAVYSSRAADAGIALSRREGKAVVQKVIARSPASLAGLHAGDELLAVDGVVVYGHRLFSIFKRLYHADRVARLTVRRGSETFDLLVTMPKCP